MKKLLCGTRADWLCEVLASRMGLPLYKVTHKQFPDGESYVRVPEEVLGEDVIVIQSLIPPQNDSILELILIAEALTENGTKEITLFAPYLAYSRQDKAFLKGEPISIKALLQALSFFGITKLVTIDIHKPESLIYFKGPAKNVIPVSSLASELFKLSDNPIIVAPDKGALERARMFSEKLNTEYIQLEKKRDVHTGEISLSSTLKNLNGRDAIIVDDIISTGGTIAEATKLLKKAGARKVFVTVSHALLVSNALEKLRTSGVEEIIAANTLPPKHNIRYVDITGEVKELLKHF